MLQRFKETLESMVLKDKQILAIRRILEGATSEESVKLLGNAIQSAGGMNTEPFLHYLGLLTPKAVAPLCTLLETWTLRNGGP